MKIMVCVMVLGTLVNAGVIHPQLAEKLAALENNEPIQVIVHMKNQADLSVMEKCYKGAKDRLFATICA